MSILFTFFTTLYGLLRAAVSALRDPEFRALLFLLFILLTVGTVFYEAVEGWRWLDALYFSVVTLTTIGYGDLVVRTDAGKIFTMIYIFLGLGTIFGFVEHVARHARKGQMYSFSKVSQLPGISHAISRMSNQSEKVTDGIESK